MTAALHHSGMGLWSRGEVFPFDWSEEGLVIGGVCRTVQLAHMELCTSRALRLTTYSGQVHDTHLRCTLAELPQCN